MNVNTLFCMSVFLSLNTANLCSRTFDYDAGYLIKILSTRCLQTMPTAPSAMTKEICRDVISKFGGF